VNLIAKHLGIGCLLALVGGYAVYAATFFAWVTATPTSAERLAHATKWANVWTAVAVSCLAAFIVNGVLALRRRRKGG
jgi:hypothetical protein